ncbi:MAG: hypothetical protein DMF76_21310 [Acidobacteria bacterium]|nr:MAG: hypothetical protein DMF76_21310 [Acidobacteriota bacterium]
MNTQNNMDTGFANELLPEELRKAQEAIHLPEVQEMLKQLAAYNLGICMPHMHDEETGNFKTLPADMIQIESDFQVSFVRKDENRQSRTIPVAWQWVDDGVKAANGCVQECVITHLQSGGEAHKTMHSTY